MRRALGKQQGVSRGAVGKGCSLVLLGLILGLLTGRCLPAAAGPGPTKTSEPTPHQSLPPDHGAAPIARQPDAARLRELAADRAFRYQEPDASADAWEAFWDRVWRRLNDFFGTSAGRLTGKYGAYAAVLALLVYTVLKLLKVDVTGAFGRSARRGPLDYRAAAEDIHAVDFRARIAEAEEAGNLRLATRLGYLEVLKHLADGGYINWQSDKTNRAYVAELTAEPLRDAFQAATREFEYVWYGDLRLNAGLYQQARVRQRAVAGLLGRRQAVAPASAPPQALPA